MSERQVEHLRRVIAEYQAEVRSLAAEVDHLRKGMEEAMEYLSLPGDGRDAAGLTLYQHLCCSPRTQACWIPPTEEQWQAAIRKAKGEGDE